MKKYYTRKIVIGCLILVLALMTPFVVAGFGEVIVPKMGTFSFNPEAFVYGLGLLIALAFFVISSYHLGDFAIDLGRSK